MRGQARSHATLNTHQSIGERASVFSNLPRTRSPLRTSAQQAYITFRVNRTRLRTHLSVSNNANKKTELQPVAARRQSAFSCCLPFSSRYRKSTTQKAPGIDARGSGQARHHTRGAKRDAHLLPDEALELPILHEEINVVLVEHGDVPAGRAVHVRPCLSRTSSFSRSLLPPLDPWLLLLLLLLRRTAGRGRSSGSAVAGRAAAAAAAAAGVVGLSAGRWSGGEVEVLVSIAPDALATQGPATRRRHAFRVRGDSRRLRLGH